MNKNVVYILGAGFSAPLGIPVMKNFIDKARLLRRGNSKYDYFENIIKLVQDTISASVYFQHDPNNIEEALSLLEMNDIVDGSKLKNDLIRFIIDVIEGTTPQLESIRADALPSNYWDKMFTSNVKWQGYCSFVSSVMGLSYQKAKDYDLNGLKIKQVKSATSYSILSLNYDLVLENVCKYLNSSFWPDNKLEIGFVKNNENNNLNYSPRLIKLHGSIDTGDIIPPTFNKGLYGSKPPISWNEAHDVLSRANEIRVIGYSLPQTDSYIKYLLMSATNKFKDLDRIDWIVLDDSTEMKDRFNNFIKFKDKRFVKGNVEYYLSSIYSQTINKYSISDSQSGALIFNDLEVVHEEFMNK